MVRFLSSLAAILLFSGGVLAQDWAWKPFSPSGKSWTVLAPGDMKPDAEALEPQSKMGSYSYSDFYGFFAVVYRDASKGFLISLPPDKSKHFKKVKNDFIVASKGQLLREEEFTYGRMNGRELLIKIPSGTMTGVEGQVIQKYRIERIRMFFIGRRFYMLLAVLPEDIVSTPTVDKFFNSFSFNNAPEAIADAYSTDEDATLKIEAGRGVLANDRDEDDDKLSVAAARPETLPANGSLTLNADGSFTYTPKENFYGQDSFSYKANDGLVDSAVVTVAITVKSVNDAPTISNLPPSTTLDELTQMSFAPLANDIDTPASALRFTLIDAPAGATIDPVSGAFRWTPAEAQGPANYTFRVSVFDGAASAAGTVNVTVNEVNVAPRLPNIPAATINELSPYTFASNGSDSDIPAQPLTYSLIDAPAGALINPATGAFTWTPTEAQGNGSTYSFTVRLSDGTASVDVPVRLTAQEVNSAPVLAEIAGQTVDELKPISIAVNASDADDPTNALSFSLGAGAPSGMTINPATGAVSWTPSEAQGAGDFPVTIRVTDNGAPALSATRTFNVRVNEVNVAPTLAPIGSKTVDEETALTFTASAGDTDLPANSLSYSLVNAPAGASINAATGAFTWTPTEAQGAGSFAVTIRVTDNGSPTLSAEETVTITVREVNKAPVIAPIGGKTVDEETPLTFNVSASDTDLPANSLTYSLVNAPAGASINASTGVFSWTPSEAQGAGSFNVTIRVTDNGTPALSAEETVTITVREVNKAPLANSADIDGLEDKAISIALPASDADLPANTLIYSIVTSPANGTLSGSGANLTYTPKADFNGTDSFTFKVNDGAADSRNATISIRIAPVNDAPVANADSAATTENTPVNIVVTTNDRDVDGDSLTVSSVTDVVGGSAVIGSGGSVQFTPNKDFRGTGSFRYTLSDGKGATAAGLVTVTVNAP